jgi:hypothetical protein
MPSVDLIRYWSKGCVGETANGRVGDAATMPRPVGRKTRRAEDMVALSGTLAGFEPFRARVIAYVASNIRAKVATIRAWDVFGDGTPTAGLKTGARYFKRLATSSARRVFRPTNQGPSSPLRRLAPSSSVSER